MEKKKKKKKFHILLSICLNNINSRSTHAEPIDSVKYTNKDVNDK